MFRIADRNIANWTGGPPFAVLRRLGVGEIHASGFEEELERGVYFPRVQHPSDLP